MTRRILTALVCMTGLLTAVTTSKADGPFDGEWQTTISLVKLKQAGDAVTGSFGVKGQFPLKGSVKGDTFTFEYKEGQVKGDGRFTLDASGHAFTGRFQVRNGRSGSWNGWRPDPPSSIEKNGSNHSRF
jgi:hypothetical protein